jgi:hypothetical protein
MRLAVETHGKRKDTYEDFGLESGVRESPEESIFGRCSAKLGPGPLWIDGVRLTLPAGPKISPVDQF